MVEAEPEAVDRVDLEIAEVVAALWGGVDPLAVLRATYLLGFLAGRGDTEAT